MTFTYPQFSQIISPQRLQRMQNKAVDIVGELPTILLEMKPVDNSFNIEKTYIYANSQILAQHTRYPISAAYQYFYLHDRIGSVRLVTDKNGNVKNKYTYEPFGQMLTGECSETIDNPFKFTGQWYDSEIGQYYLRARMYDPYLSRFTTFDPVDGDFKEPLTLHKYLYCLNDPINHVDPSGKILDTVIAVSEGAGMYAKDLAVAGAALSFAYAIIMQNEFYQMAIESIVTGVTYEVESAIDFGFAVFTSARTKITRRHIAGTIKQISEHFDAIDSGNPGDPEFKTFFNHIRRHLGNLKKYVSRLRGKEQEEAMKDLDDFWKLLEEKAREHGLPWES